MFKNNLKILFYYLIVIGITYGFLFAFDALYQNSTTQLNNIIVKIFFVLFYISLFALGGRIVGIRQRSSGDFFSFSLVFFIGLALYFLAYLGGGLNFSENMNILMLPGQIFLSPFFLITSILGKEFNLFYYVIISLVISISVGLSIKRNRVKRRYKKKSNYRR